MKIKTKLKSAFALVKNLPFAFLGIFCSDDTLACKKGFAVDNFLPSIVTLFGKNDDGIFRNLSIEVSTGCDTIEIVPNCNSGKNPTVELFSFQKHQMDFIFFSVEPSDDECYAAVFGVKNCDIQTHFDSRDFAKNYCDKAEISPRKVTAARKAIQEPETQNCPAESNVRPAKAVFPYFNPSNGAFSLQVWMQSEKSSSKNPQLFFTNLKFCDGEFQSVFCGIVASD